MRGSTEREEGMGEEMEQRSSGDQKGDRLIPLRGRSLAGRYPLQHQGRRSFLDPNSEPWAQISAEVKDKCRHNLTILPAWGFAASVGAALTTIDSMVHGHFNLGAYLLNECRIREMLLCAGVRCELPDEIGILEHLSKPKVGACAGILGYMVISVSSHPQGMGSKRTLCILYFLKALAKSGAVFVLDTLLVGNNSFIILASSVQGGTLPRITLSPGWIESHALEVG